MPDSIYPSALPISLDDREYGKFELDNEGRVRVRTVTEGTLTGEIRPSGLTNGGKVTEVLITSSSWTPLPVTPLTDRNALGIQNSSAQDIKVNFDNSVPGFVGMLISAGSERTYDITDQIVVYAKCSSGSVTINVEEIS